jgi:hypothetical protein
MSYEGARIVVAGRSRIPTSSTFTFRKESGSRTRACGGGTVPEPGLSSPMSRGRDAERRASAG